MFSRIHDVYLYVYFSNREDNFSECTQTSSASDLIIAYSKGSISLIVKWSHMAEKDLQGTSLSQSHISLD